jgi:hypothetical protein
MTCMALAQNAWGDNIDAPKVDPKSIQVPVVTKPMDVPISTTIESNNVAEKASGSGGAPTSAPMADENCKSAFKQATVICVANLNPSVQSAVSTISKMMAAGGAALSMADACNKFNDALKIANEAITAYNSACAAVQYRCKFSCSHAATDSRQKAQAAKSSMNYGYAGLLEQRAAGDDQNAELCANTFHKNMMDAGIGLAGIVTSSALASSCQDKTTDKTAATCDSANPLCVKGVDCSLSTNASNPTCICNASPNAPGCPGATSYGSAYGSPNYGTGGDTATQTSFPTSDSMGGTDSSGVTRGAAAAPTTAADGSSTSAMGGGGALTGDGMSPAVAVQNAATADKKKTLNPNVLSGYDEGGGGGARGSSFSAGGYGAGSGYGAYMPGAAKDPSRSLASQTVSSQVTSAGAKSNWEKINERYLENKSTLMGE